MQTKSPYSHATTVVQQQIKKSEADFHVGWNTLRALFADVAPITQETLEKARTAFVEAQDNWSKFQAYHQVAAAQISMEQYVAKKQSVLKAPTKLAPKVNKALAAGKKQLPMKKAA